MGKNKKRNNVMKKKLKQATNAKKSINPFEVHLNKQKHDILGRNKKNDRGMPGISRNKAIKKRKDTLLQDYKLRHKANNYMDRRFGESDGDAKPEDKAAMRFALERKKNKSNMFNLNEDEELTHLGRSIGNMDKFDDAGSESDEDERLQGDFVKKVHFGGFLTKKDSAESEKSHKAIMEEIIADRIKHKQERQREKENNMDLTEKLDGDWKDIQKLMVGLKQSKDNDTSQQRKNEDYDIKVQELKFEAKGKATDKLKSADDLALEERQKLEKLEGERIQRMMGTSTDKSQHIVNHISADGLDDEFEFDDQFSREQNDIIPSKRLKEPNTEDVSDDEDTKDNSDDDDDEQQDDDIDGEEGNNQSGSGEETDDSYTDILSENETQDNDNIITSKSSKKRVNKATHNEETSNIPYVLDCPNSFDDFFELVSRRNINEISTIIERIIKCNHPSLGSANKEKLEDFFAILLQYVNEISTSTDTNIELLDPLTIHLQTLVQMSPKATSKLLLDVIVEMRNDFLTKLKGKEKHFPGLSPLIFLKLVSILYTTSDFQHCIATPSMVFMSEILSVCKIYNIKDIFRGLFVSSVFYEYVSVSKRFVPEVITFLNCVLQCALAEYPKHILAIDSKLEEISEQIKISIQILELDDEVGPKNKMIIQSLNATLFLIEKFSVLYRENPCYTDIFTDTKRLIAKLPLFNLNSALQKKVENVSKLLNIVKPKEFLKRENKRPPSLKLFEPRIQDHFDGKKQHHGSKKKLERQKLEHKFKREMKGAMREIRRDNHFIAAEKLNEQLEKDNSRKEKLKRLYHDLASQEGEFKKYKKRK